MSKHYKHLTRDQRYYIEISLSSSIRIAEIAKALKIHISTIYREIKRNHMDNGSYHYLAAQGKSEVRSYNAKQYRRFAQFKPRVIKYITRKLEIGWSPEVISGRMLKDLKYKIGYKTIYRYIWYDKRSGGTLYKYLPHRGKKYKYGSVNKTIITNRIDISKRPKIVDRKKRVGDWEVDTIIGKRNGSKHCLLTMVERKTKFTLIRKLKDKTAQSLQAAIEGIYSNSIMPFITITSDNGTEFANHQQIAENIGCQFFFARPYHSSDRGLNEHINGSIRYFTPKKTDFAHVADDKIYYIQNILNDRPRKSLGFLTANEVMNKYLKRVNRKLF